MLEGLQKNKLKEIKDLKSKKKEHIKTLIQIHY